MLKLAMLLILALTLFLPFVGANSTTSVNRSQQINSNQQAQLTTSEPPSPDDLPATPQPNLPILPAPEEKTQSFNYAEATRGQVVHLGNMDIQLPEDAYMYGVVAFVDYVVLPGKDAKDYMQPPLAELRRGDAVVFVEVNTGRMQFGGATEGQKVQARQAFDFLVKALGVDKILEAK